MSNSGYVCLTGPEPSLLTQHGSLDLQNPNHRRALGAFDEESCRYFLRSVGADIVPCYPFSFGMEEVYTRILETYGRRAACDAISVLQELLEDETSAGGFGDDGDVFRSWRHGWRHRNIDSLNPFIPKVGKFVLLPATRRDIRQAKKENFIELSENGGLRALSDSFHIRFPDDLLQPTSPNRRGAQMSPTSPKPELPSIAIPRQRSRNALASENREARIIEGTIFSRKGASKRLSSLPFVPPLVAPRRISRGSWLREIRTVFRTGSIKVRVSSKEL